MHHFLSVSPSAWGFGAFWDAFLCSTVEKAGCHCLPASSNRSDLSAMTSLKQVMDLWSSSLCCFDSAPEPYLSYKVGFTATALFLNKLNSLQWNWTWKTNLCKWRLGSQLVVDDTAALKLLRNSGLQTMPFRRVILRDAVIWLFK